MVVFLILTTVACEQEKKKAENRGKAVGETLKNAKDKIGDAASQIQDNMKRVEDQLTDR